MGKNLKKLTILHSNDMHGDFLAENLDSKMTGGVSMLSGYVNQVRNQEKNVIYAIAGDMFRGSVIDSEYKGMSTIELMNLLGPDVVTLGNHEIDYGVAHLLFIEKCAKFPIINANLFVKTNHQRLFRSHYVMELDGMHILFIGALTEDVIAQTKQESVIGTFVDINQAANEITKICNTYKAMDIDLTILLTHIGYEEDKRLAAELSPELGIDIIIGGHSHTLPEKAITENGILIVQAGTGTDRIGRFDVMVDTDTNTVDSYEWKTIPIDESHCPVDKELEEILSTFKEQTDEKYGRIVTRFPRALTHPERSQETELGNLIADILKDALGVDIMMLGSGSVRIPSLGPIVRYQNLCECFPYDDSVHMIKVSGAMLRRMVLHILRDDAWVGHTEFYQFSKGVEIEYDIPTHKLMKFKFNGEDVTDENVFTVALQKFHFNNLEAFFNITLEEAEAVQKPRVLSTSTLDIIEEYLSSNTNLHREVEGRLVVHGRNSYPEDFGGEKK